MQKKLGIIFLLLLIISNNADAQAPKPPAPIFHPVGVSAEDEEFVRSKILENAPAMPEKKEQPKPIAQKPKLKAKVKKKKAVIKKTKTTPKKVHTAVKKPHKTIKLEPAVHHKEHQTTVQNYNVHGTHSLEDPTKLEPPAAMQPDDSISKDMHNEKLPMLDENKIDIHTANQAEIIPDEINPDEIEPDKSLLDKSFKEVYDPIKENFFLIAGFILLFPMALFLIMLKVLNKAKRDFAEERKLNQIHAQQEREKFLEREAALLKAEREEDLPAAPTKFEETPPQEVRDEIIKMAQEKLERKTHAELEQSDIEIPDEAPTMPSAPSFVSSTVLEAERKLELEKIEEEETVESNSPDSEADDSEQIDEYKVSDDLKFSLTKKDGFVFLTCSLNGNDIGILKMDDSTIIQKVRKIESKPDKDVYMVKLDEWRGLVEISENSAKYLMDI